MIIEVTDFQADQILRALYKRAQVLRAVERRGGSDQEVFEKLIAVKGLIEEIKMKMGK